MCRDWRQAGLAAPDAALCAFAEKLTLQPGQMLPADLDELRAQGFDDRAIHDAVQVIGYFNYINRVASSLGVESDDFVHPWELGVPARARAPLATGRGEG